MSQQIDFTIGALLDDSAARFPDREALVYPERGLRYSYRELKERCRQVAKGLLAMGIKKCDHLSIWANNVPDRKYGEQVMAAVVVKAGTELSEEEVKEFCRGRIANYKIPEYVRFVDSYPMTASGKIQKFKLREMAICELRGRLPEALRRTGCGIPQVDLRGIVRYLFFSPFRKNWLG